MNSDSYEVVGELSTLTTTIYVLRDKWGDYYVCTDVEKFKDADIFQKNMQKIQRIIGKVLFLGRGTLNIYLYNDKHRQTYKMLAEEFSEDKNDYWLRELVNAGHGADHCNNEVFRDVKKVLTVFEVTDLLNMSKGIYANEVNIIVALTFDDRKKVILERVFGYSEGYTILREEIPREIFEVCQLDVVKEVFDEKNKKLEGYIS